MVQVGRHGRWLIFLLCFTSHCVVPVCVPAEQRVMLSAAALSVSADRGEVPKSNVKEFTKLTIKMKVTFQNQKCLIHLLI